MNHHVWSKQMPRIYPVETYVTIPITVRVRASISPGRAATYHNPSEPAEVDEWEIVGFENYTPSKNEKAIFQKITASFEDDFSDEICNACLQAEFEEEEPPERDYSDFERGDD